MEYDTQLAISEKDTKQFVRQLNQKKIGFFDVPESLRRHPNIVNTERKLGIRKSDRRGYDIIRKEFFVEEIVLEKDFFDEIVEKHISNYFSDFASYYEFLNGDIYENACYYQYNFSQAEINIYKIDLSKINTVALISNTIEDFFLEMSEEELRQYKEIEKSKSLRKRWIKKFNACNDYNEFKDIIRKLNKSKFSKEADLRFFLYNFIFYNKDKAFDIMMKYVSEGTYQVYNIEKALCSIYDPGRVLTAYDYSLGTKATINSHKKRLKEYIKLLENKEVKFVRYSYFDESTHFFCYKVFGYIGNGKNTTRMVDIYRYFETVQELAEYLKNDLSYCDLSKAILPDVDFSVYKIGKYTNLPIQNQNHITYFLYKGYDRKENCFFVKQRWQNVNGQAVKKYKHTFRYFFDFVFFLKNDLSEAELLFCDGLINLHDFSKLNLLNARLRSEILDRLEVSYELSAISVLSTETFPSIIKNEEETAFALASDRGDFRTEETIKNQKVYYVSDLHLLHKIQNSFCKTKDDVLYTIQTIIDNLLQKVRYWEKNIILIGGDTSSDFNLFSLYIELLRKSIDENNLDVQVVFLLGNHELWGFPDCSFEEIVQKYEVIITKYRMHLLQNNILYKDDDNMIQKITTEELLSAPKETLRMQLRSARIILFGGLAFSGCNEEFNADNGIYRFTINRNQEIAESKAFENLYNIVCTTFFDKNVIVFTHTPQKDWCSHGNLQSGFVYVSGHTHRNHFYDDGEYRIYADNQIGYKQKKPCLKYFYLEDEYDWFSEYDDGIYKITREQYINFYRGKNIQMQYGTDINILYMLKKNGYYCFIHQSKRNQLTILNGGAMKKLAIKDINYYYDKMDAVVTYIKDPLDKFASVQNQIAKEIKAIGGSGTIHGAIIDIDFNNHIYVNPYDLTLTGYWASDIICKKVFSSIPELLETNCPLLYANYTQRLNGKVETALVLKKDIKQELDSTHQYYLNTDIYKASREIKKMQKLSANILSAWYEPTQKMLE